MSTRPNKYPPRKDTAERLMLQSILQPLMECNPEELKNLIDVLTDDNPYPEDEHWVVIYKNNHAVAEVLRRMMRFVAMNFHLQAATTHNKDLETISIRWNIP